MRTLTYHETLVVAGGAQEGDEPPKHKDEGGPLGALTVACVASVGKVRKSPTLMNAGLAAVSCNLFVQAAIPAFASHLQAMQPVSKPNLYPRFWR